MIGFSRAVCGRVFGPIKGSIATDRRQTVFLTISCYLIRRLADLLREVGVFGDDGDVETRPDPSTKAKPPAR
ncbi:hypothetical protein B2M20_05455 [Nitrobacter vulgaris]|uniref:Uncharacterized protein n=1 Tax=Nitrobacter vulgaris TaxID=29421 RepID=A0A1V4I0V3_NITVU|nr:hypothetical protein B2M20_05455 [Nitrobacter vulgaris]